MYKGYEKIISFEKNQHFPLDFHDFGPPDRVFAHFSSFCSISTKARHFFSKMVKENKNLNCTIFIYLPNVSKTLVTVRKRSRQVPLLRGLKNGHVCGPPRGTRPGQHFRGDSHISSVSRTSCHPPPPPRPNSRVDYVALYRHRHPERVRLDEN